MSEQRDETARSSLSEDWRMWLMMLAVIAASAIAAYGHDYGHGAPAVSNSETYRPTPLPDRIVLTWTDDPATTQAVTWRTDGSVVRAYAEIAVAEEGPAFTDRSTSYPAVTEEVPLGRTHACSHTVTFADLSPDTLYAYRVGDGINWSEWNQFRTASDRAEPFTFLYIGDAQNDVHSHWSRVVREAYRDAPRAAFMLHAGDLINRASADGEWGEWFAATGHIHQTMPCIATPGNHEYEGTMPLNRLLRRKRADNPPELSRHWRPSFAFPENGPEGLEETAYWLDYQGVRIISLNSNERIEDQAGWLEDVLASNPNRWTIVTFHHPVYSMNPARDNVEVRNAWQPLFDKYRVDLVLQGHDHTYARSGLMAHDNSDTDAMAHNREPGTVYVISVAGPKMYDVREHADMRRTAENMQLYQVIHVDSETLRYEARTATGRLYDAFTLHKQGGAANTLVDHVPEAPPNTRDASLAGR